MSEKIQRFPESNIKFQKKTHSKSKCYIEREEIEQKTQHNLQYRAKSILS